MSVRNRMALALALVLPLYVGLIALGGRTLLLPSYLHLEHEQALRDIERCRLAIAAEGDALDSMAHDWADWDDTYVFVEDHNQDYIDSNLMEETFDTTRTQLIAMVDSRGQVVWNASQGLDLTNTPLAVSSWPADFRLRLDTQSWQAQSGLLPTPSGPLLVVARPIRDSVGTASPKGTLVMGRLLGPELLATLVHRAQVPFTAQPVAAATGAGLEPRITAVDDDWLDLALVLPDLDGRPYLRLSARQPRAIVAEGRRALWFALAAVTGLMAVVLAALYALLRRMVLSPARQLAEFAAAIETEGDTRRRMAVTRRDEFGTLATAFNALLDRLAALSHQLMERMYRAGAAEQARGILHNARNALSPLVTDLDQAAALSRDWRLDRLRQATEELAGEETPAVRRNPLQAYVRLALDHLSQRQQQLRQRLLGMEQRIGVIEAMFNSLDTGAADDAALMEPVSVMGALPRALDLLPTAARGCLTVAPAADSDGWPLVAAARVPLLQVLANLLLNAAEAAAGREYPCRVTVAVERIGASLRLTLADDGPGIAAEVADRLFQLGTSNKPGAGRGQGLHWSANAIRRMSGTLALANRVGAAGAVATLTLPVWSDDEGGESDR